MRNRCPLTGMNLLLLASLQVIFLLVLPSALLYAAGFAPTGSMTAVRSGHTATLLNNGKVLITGGWDGATSFATAELYDPATGTFTPTGPMTGKRTWHTATLLGDGTVLIAGGWDGATSLASAEIYDPATATFTAIANAMNIDRRSHTATSLTDGKVLITGGAGSDFILPSAEIYDPADGTFTYANDMMAIGRQLHTATRLEDGTGRVLVTGGSDGSAGTASAELYIPASGLFTAISGTMKAARFGHTATSLQDKTVLIAGGNGQTSAELFNPANGIFTPTGAMNTSRTDHAAVLLADGSVLIAGGGTNSAELYNPASKIFSATGSMSTSRSGHTATRLADGRVLIAGGGTSSAELYDIRTPSGLRTMTTKRGNHTATLLPDGTVLVAGGRSDASTTPLKSTELYTPAGGTLSAGTPLTAARYGHTATLLKNGTVLIAGGCSGAVGLVAAELYDPGTRTFTPTTGAMGSGRFFHTATLLPDGRVLLTGGYTTGNISLNSAEVYDPASGTFSPAAGAMATARAKHAATLLATGKVLIAGGTTSKDVELFDPASGTFSTAGTLQTTRSYLYPTTATRLADGTVLITGGVFGRSSVIPAERYDPATGSFAVDGSMSADRNNHTATLLFDGTVLIAGGEDKAATFLATAEFYVPASKSFTTATNMQASRSGHTATLLSDGSVFLAGGWNGGSPLDSAELFAGPPPLVLTVTSLDPASGVAIGVSPADSRGEADGVTTFARSCVKGTSLTLTAPLTAQNGNVFSGWSGCDTASGVQCTFTVTASRTVTAVYALPPVSVTVATSSPGLSYTVDGVTYRTARTFAWTPGSSHTVATTTPQTSYSTMYDFVGWSDGGAISHGVTAPAAAATYTAVFRELQPAIAGTPAMSVAPGAAYGFTPTAANSSYFTITGKPAWAVFDPATGSLTGTPVATDTGVYSGIVITAWNGSLSAALPAFAITVSSMPVRIGATPYPKISAAYQAAFDAAMKIAVIEAQASAPSEPLIFDKGLEVQLYGGLDTAFSPTRSGVTTSGSVIVKSGSLVIDRLVIR